MNSTSIRRLVRRACAGAALAALLGAVIGSSAAADPTTRQTGAITSAELRQSGEGQQRWLSVPGSRIAANPNNSTLTGGETSQNTGAALPLGANYIADDWYNQQRSVLETTRSDQQSPEAPDVGASQSVAAPFTTANGWETTHASSTEVDGVTRVVVDGGSDWGSIRRQVTVDLDATPYLRVDVAAVSATWNLKVNLTGSGDDETAPQRPSSHTGATYIDLADEYDLHGTQTFTIRLFTQGVGSTLDLSALAFTAAPAFPAVQDAAFDEDFSAPTGWTVTSGDATLASNGAEGTVKIQKNAASGSLAKSVTVDLDQSPILAVSVPRASDKWALKLHDEELDKDYTIQNDTAQLGVFTYDIPQITGWSGERTFGVKLYAVGQQYSSTTYDRVSLIPAGLSGWGQRAADFSTAWQPDRLDFSASYGDAGDVEGDDHFHGTEALVRSFDATGLDGYVTFSGTLSVTGQTGTAQWDAVSGVITIVNENDTRAIALPDGATVVFSQADGWQATAQPTATSTRWNATVPAGEAYDIGIGFAVGADETTAVQRALDAAAADPAADIAEWTDYFDDLLARVPEPEDFSLHGVDAYGVTADDVRSAYYRGWVNLEENVLPPTPETGNPYAAIGTDKGDNWMKGIPGNANVASWDSLLAAQNLVYVDPDVAWSTLHAVLGQVESDGALGGQNLPSRIAQTAWILYQVTGSSADLAADYDALARLLPWEGENLRWISATNDNAQERNASYAVSLAYDLGFAAQIADETGHTADVQAWDDLRAQLISDYTDWFFTDDGGLLSVHYADGSSPDEAGDVIAETTGLVLQDLPQPYLGYVQQRFDDAFDTDAQFAGFGATKIKAPHEQLTLYGLIDSGQLTTASSFSNLMLRDVVRSGRFAEEYWQSSDSAADKPYATGVWPSTFGITNIIDAVWLNNGIRYDQGAPAEVSLPGVTGTVHGLTSGGQPWEPAGD